MTQHMTVLVVYTDEPVTPDHIARRIGEAAATYGALRLGEGIAAANSFIRYNVQPPHAAEPR